MCCYKNNHYENALKSPTFIQYMYMQGPSEYDLGEMIERVGYSVNFSRIAVQSRGLSTRGVEGEPGRSVIRDGRGDPNIA